MERTQVFVVDASVAVKWYVKEEERKKALRLREDFVSDAIELEAPTLILYEVGNALRHHPGSTSSECFEAVRQLRNLGLRLHELDDGLAHLAADISYKDDVTYYDAVYLALARTLKAKLVTADKKLCDHLSEESRHSTILLNEYS